MTTLSLHALDTESSSSPTFTLSQRLGWVCQPEDVGGAFSFTEPCFTERWPDRCDLGSCHSLDKLSRPTSLILRAFTPSIRAHNEPERHEQLRLPTSKIHWLSRTSLLIPSCKSNLCLPGNFSPRALPSLPTVHSSLRLSSQKERLTPTLIQPVQLIQASYVLSGLPNPHIDDSL